MVDAKPSKSALKREDQALKALGQELIDLNPSQLDQLPLDERLREAIDTAHGIRAHGALRRQRQLIGKLLRQSDAMAIRAGLELLMADSNLQRRRFRLAEDWRDRLLQEDSDSVTACVEQTGADRALLLDCLQRVATARNARAEKTARRELFRTIHTALEAKEGH